ncbi:MAG: 5-bromo-4-chloroindolyl phosphate hydrolysis family protein [Eubacteriales bacterium]|nr:5-bromo-4-chloroindolyl phosphate hydrolysis family protein [Eubacteriales bacterium]
MDNREFDDLGNKIQDIIDRAVSSRDYQKLNQNINQTVNKAIDTGSEALRKALNEAFGQSGEYTKKYENKTKEFEERRRRERMEQEKKEQEVSRQANLSTLYRGTAGTRIKGILMTTFGGIFTGGMGVGAAVLLITGAVLEPGLMAGGVVMAAIALAGGSVLAGGIRSLNKVNRFQKYRKALGNHTYCNFEQLSRTVGKSLKFVKKDIKAMITKGWFLEGHVDEQETCLITSDETYRQYVETQKQLEMRTKEKAAEEAKRKASPEVEEILDRGNEYLRKIKASNDAILGEEISVKISRMELIVEKIFERAEEHPQIIPDLKHLMDYYLPMTVKLLDAYEDMDSQPVQGENICSSKKEIEDTIDTLNLAFEKLLDSVFQDTAWDVSSDISVLHTMLAREGLTENDFEKMKKM